MVKLYSAHEHEDDEEKNSIGVYVADAFLSYCASLKVVVPNPGIEIPKKNDLILLWDACQ